MTMFEWPSSRKEILEIQTRRKRAAVEIAMNSRFYEGRLGVVDLDRLDDPEVWARIPMLTKEELRSLSDNEFYSSFCIEPRMNVVEYWRSGGVTGRPLFYPRSALDMKYGLLAFRRAWPLIGATKQDLVHLSFPLGIHPVGQLYARAAEDIGMGTVWCGSGNNTPSEAQLDLISSLRPTIWAGMASYGLHLANLAEARGIDLAGSSVDKLVVAAEPLSSAKRQKLERMWGAEVFDHFGMTEGSFIAGECGQHDGMYVWSDLFFIEVVHPETGLPVGEGEVGSLVVTPLWINEITPFLRWNSGDLVSWINRGEADGPWSVFPVMQHARRTLGFFKVRGVNINHDELEDLMFSNAQVTDFKAEVYSAEDGLDVLRIFLEIRRDENTETVVQAVQKAIQQTFEVQPEVELLELGTLGREFEASVKPARFVDNRG